MVEGKRRVTLVGIAGSPRRRGNTELLLDEALRGASEAGAEVKKFVLNDMVYIPCQHCDGCVETGECIYQDDMQLIYPELRVADRLILASPMFFKGLTAQTKAMIDRCQALWCLRYRLKQRVGLNRGGQRLGLFVSVGGMGLSDLFAPAVATVRSYFKVIQVEYWGELLYRKVDERGAIVHHPAALREAYEAGGRLALGTGGVKEAVGDSSKKESMTFSL